MWSAACWGSSGVSRRSDRPGDDMAVKGVLRCASGARSADLEGPVHDRVVRVAHVLVGALAQRDRDLLGADEPDPGDHLVEAGTGEMEVVDRGLVMDRDRV